MSSANPGVGSQRSLRERNRQLVLDALTTSGAQTQAALARLTSLSTGTISNIVSELRAENRVVTASVVAGGKRSLEVSLVADPRIVIGIDIGRTHLRVLGCDFAQRTFGDTRASLDAGHRPHETLGLARRLVDQMLARHDVAYDRVALSALALPASLGTENGQIVEESALPHWARIDLRAVASESLATPVQLEHDARLGALAHTAFGRNPGARNLVYFKIASGIGMGFAIEGRPYSTTSGLSGEVGHFPVEGGTEVCYCGKRGCLETVSSARRVVADFALIRPGRVASVGAVIAAVEDGDAAAERILAEAGSAFGRQLGLVCNLLSPDVVVLGGPLMRVGRSYLDAALQTVRQSALPSSYRDTRFELSDLDGADEVYGACAFALRHLAIVA